MNFSACAGQLLSTSLVSQPDPLASVFSCLPDSTSLTYVSFEHGGNNCMRRVRTFALELSNTILSTRSWPLQIYIYIHIYSLRAAAIKVHILSTWRIQACYACYILWGPCRRSPLSRWFFSGRSMEGNPYGFARLSIEHQKDNLDPFRMTRQNHSLIVTIVHVSLTVPANGM